MAGYAHAEIGRLERELSYVPARLRTGHLGRLAQLLPELNGGQLYSYDRVFHGVTRFHPDSGGERLLRGSSLLRDLGMMLQRLSGETPLAAGEGDKIETAAVAAQRLRVTQRTVRRWGWEGLPVCRYLFADGSCAWGVKSAALERFLEKRSQRSRQSSAKVTDAEKQAILERAGVLREKEEAPAAVVRRVSEESGRSVTTVRRILRTQEEAAARGRVRRRRGGVGEEELDKLVAAYREGRRVSELAREFGRSASTVYRILHEALVERALALKIKYMPSPEFAAADAEALCLGDDGLFTYPPEPGPKMMKAPKGLPPYLRSLYEIPLLSREREGELFRKYNYLKYRMAMLQERLREEGYRAELIDRFEEFRQGAAQVQRILIRCNLRLVVSVAKRHIGPLARLMDLVSEGNMCLMRAVECFDYQREARFATYGTWALTKRFARVVPEENYRMRTFVTGREELFTRVGDERENATERVEEVAHLRSLLARATRHLTEREREIVESHYGTNGRTPRTLEEIGQVLGLTRERIRQIEVRALGKLRGLLGSEGLEALA